MQKFLKTLLRIILLLLTVIVLAGGLVYMTGVVYFQTHFPFRTTFLGYDVSQREVSAIDECMRLESDARTLTILERDGAQETLALSTDIGYVRTAAEPAGGWIPEDSSWLWFLSLRDETALPAEVSFSYDQALLEEAVLGLRALSPDYAAQPENARLEWQDGELVMIPENEGSALYVYRVQKAVRAAVDAEADTVDL